MLTSNLLIASAEIFHTVLRLAYGLFFARIVLSWIQPDPDNALIRRIIRGIYDITDPVLDGARRALPFLRTSGIDFSPIAVFLAIGFLDSFVTRSLFQLAAGM